MKWNGKDIAPRIPHKDKQESLGISSHNFCRSAHGRDDHGHVLKDDAGSTCIWLILISNSMAERLGHIFTQQQKMSVMVVNNMLVVNVEIDEDTWMRKKLKDNSKNDLFSRRLAVLIMI